MQDQLNANLVVGAGSYSHAGSKKFREFAKNYSIDIRQESMLKSTKPTQVGTPLARNFGMCACDGKGTATLMPPPVCPSPRTQLVMQEEYDRVVKELQQSNCHLTVMFGQLDDIAGMLQSVSNCWWLTKFVKLRQIGITVNVARAFGHECMRHKSKISVHISPATRRRTRADTRARGL